MFPFRTVKSISGSSRLLAVLAAFGLVFSGSYLHAVTESEEQEKITINLRSISEVTLDAGKHDKLKLINFAATWK